MRNQKDTSHRPRRPMDAIAGQRRWEGYGDAAQGLGFRAEYDSWPKGEQRNYERGRQIAVMLKARTGGVPRWARNLLLTTALDRAVGRAVHAPILREVTAYFGPKPEAA